VVSQDRHARATECSATPCRSAWDASSGSAIRAGAEVPALPLARRAGRLRGRNFATEGVSCEACHGPATGWLGYHVTKDATHDESVKRGMYDTKDVVKRTDKCLTCHLGTSEKFVDHEMIAAGHPDLVFELEAFSAAMPRHWKERPTPTPTSRCARSPSAARPPARQPRSPRAAASRADLAGVRRARLLRLPSQPDARRRQLAPGRGLREPRAPGLPQLQVSRYLTARRVLQAWDAQAAPELDGVMAKLQIEASRLTRARRGRRARHQARGIVDRGINRR
jgi:hypothetical protein